MALGSRQLLVKRCRDAVKQFEDERHTDDFTTEHLGKVSSARVVVHSDRDFVDARQRMQDVHIRLCKLQLLWSQDVAVLQAQVFLFAGKTFPLDTGHVQDVQFRHRLIQTLHLGVRDLLFVQDLFLNIIRYCQFLWRDQHKADAGVAGEGKDERMNGASEFQVAAQTDGQVVQVTLQAVNGHQVGQCLGRMLVTAVARIDDRNRGIHRSDHRRTFLWMTHGSDVCKAADDTDGVSNAFTFSSGGRICRRKTDHAAAQLQHCRLKAQSGAGAWLIEQGSQFFALADFGIFCRILDDVVSYRKQLVDFLNGKIHRID